jgi:hypothetical protein
MTKSENHSTKTSFFTSPKEYYQKMKRSSKKYWSCFNILKLMIEYSITFGHHKKEEKKMKLENKLLYCLAGSTKHCRNAMTATSPKDT